MLFATTPAPSPLCAAPGYPYTSSCGSLSGPLWAGAGFDGAGGGASSNAEPRLSSADQGYKLHKFWAQPLCRSATSPLSRSGYRIHTSLRGANILKIGRDFPPPCGEGSGVGVVQEAPDRSIMHHPHLQRLPTSLSDPGQARDRQGRRARLGWRCVSIVARSGDGQGLSGKVAPLTLSLSRTGEGTRAFPGTIVGVSGLQTFVTHPREGKENPVRSSKSWVPTDRCGSASCADRDRGQAPVR